MKPISEAVIPRRLKKMRLERHMTQQKLADSIGVTKGYISRIENAAVAPPLGKLISIAQAFEVDVSAFFDTEETKVYATVTKKGERPVIARDQMSSGMYEHLSLTFPERTFEAYVLKVPPGAASSQANQHRGQELLFVLKGTVEMSINNETYSLDQGDSIFFDSTYPHFGISASKNGAELFCVIYQDN